MGLSVAIGGSMAVITLVMSLSMFPMMIEDIHDVGITNSEISQIKKQFDKTNLEISSISGQIGEKEFDFVLTNTGSEKIWNYENFDFFVNYDANVSGIKVRATEQFTYNETGSFLPPPPPLTYLRPISDILVGSWQSEPLYEKIDEKTRDDGDFILSPLLSSSPANDVEVKLNSTTDPEISSGHTVSYSYRPSDLVDSKGMTAYGGGGESFPSYRTWSNATEFSSEASGQNIDDQIITAVLKASPNSLEKILVTLDNSGFLHVQTWNGSSWSSNWNTELSPSNGDVRVFDIAYEENTGDIVVVFSDETTQLKYRKRINDVWDSANQNAGSTLSDVPRLIIAKSHPTSNDIFVGILTDSKTLEAMRWSGSANSWDNQITTTAAPSVNDNWVFDLAFERNSGDTFLIWGDDSNNLQYREFSSGWKAELVVHDFVTDGIEIVSAGYDQDPTSDKIAVGLNLFTNNLSFGAWNGTNWVVLDPASLTIGGGGDKKIIGVDFEKTTGAALFVFVQNPPDTAKISWRTWDSATGFSGITVESGGDRPIQNLQVMADPLSNNIMVLYVDDRNDLFHRKWNGTSFSALASALHADLSDRANQSYSFVWNKFLVFELVVELRQGTTVIAQWNEGNPFGQISYIQKDRELSFAQADSITDYSDLRIRFKIADGQFEWSWAELFIGLPPDFFGINKWIINEISSEVLDPRVLNPRESASIYGNLQYPVYLNGVISVTVITDNGVAVTASKNITD